MLVLKEAMVSPSYFIKKQYNDKHTVLQITLTEDTIDKFFLLEYSCISAYKILYTPESRGSIQSDPSSGKLEYILVKI